ncbi:MAG: hypothetical protein PVH68_04045 [Armatimonadota bacterium]
MHRMIQQVTIAPRERRIYVTPTRTKDEFTFLARRLCADIDAEILQCWGHAGFWNPTTLREPSDDAPLMSARQLKAQEMVLAGAHFYGEPKRTMTSSSELVEFYIDGVIALARAARTARQWQRAKPALKALTREVFERGAHLHSLWYLADEVKRYLRRRNKTGLPLARRFGHLRDQRMPGLLDEVARNAWEAISRRLPPNQRTLRLMLFGRSAPVSRLLRLLARKKDIRTTVLAPVLRPVAEGENLGVGDAVREAECGGEESRRLTLEVVPNTHLTDAIAQADAVLMGCEGVDSRGNVHNSAGCLALGRLAKHASKPVLVLTESWKVLEPPWAVELPSFDRRLFVREAGIYSYLEEANGSGCPEENGLAVSERMAARERLVSAIVTEKGAASPREAWKTNEGKPVKIPWLKPF